MDTKKSTSTSPNFYDRRREYLDMMQAIKGIKLEPYEDATVMARTILDAASEEENAFAMTKPHIAIVLREGGTVQIRKRGKDSVCTVEMQGRVKESGRSAKTFVESGSCFISDEDGSIYAAGVSALNHVAGLFSEFGKGKNG